MEISEKAGTKKTGKTDTEQAISKDFGGPFYGVMSGEARKTYEKLRDGFPKRRTTPKYAKTRSWPRTSRGSDLHRPVLGGPRRDFGGPSAWL